MIMENATRQPIFGGIRPIRHRTLRRQVTAYVPYTKRHVMLEELSPDEAVDRRYNLVMENVQRRRFPPPNAPR